jgi:hypothetical protein
MEILREEVTELFFREPLNGRRVSIEADQGTIEQ